MQVSATEGPTRVVICGAGVIGSAIAYYLSLRGVAATVIERYGVACAASGKSGGFLASDWCDSSVLGALARKSFQLHTGLAQSFATDYGYRRMTTFAVKVSTAGVQHDHNLPDEFAWLDRNGVPYAVLGTQETTAQVQPEQFTRALLQAAEARGARLLLGCVDGIEVRQKRVCGVRVDGQMLAADVVVVAMGPWSNVAAQWLPIPTVMGLKGHSITLRPQPPLPAHALFANYVTAGGEQLEPEIYPRPDGDVYLCGLSDMTPLPERPELVQPRPEAGPVLQQIAADLSTALKGLQPQRVQACYRPVYDDGLPLLGQVPGVQGAYLATGHSCWGILNAPATGLSMAELIVDGHAQSVDLSPYDPQRAWVAR